MSKPQCISNAQSNLFENRLSNLLNLDHPLIMLAKQIDWASIERDVLPVFSNSRSGQPPKSIRLMVGLLMIQNMYRLSDELVVSQWVENPYHQYFCGYDFMQWQFPINPSSMTRWRHKLGPEVLEKILGHTLAVAVKTEVAKEKDFEKVIADTTVMEANIAYPTDGRLLNQALQKLVAVAKKEGVSLRQSYTRLGKQLDHQISRYAHAKQYKRVRKAVKKLKCYLGRVVRDIERNLLSDQQRYFDPCLQLAKRLLDQEVKSKNKLYSLHAPHAYCIAKGKARSPYEYGCKVALVVSHKQGLVLSARALNTAQYDGHTLKDSIDHVQAISGIQVKRSFVDRGYRGHGIDDEDCQVFISGQRRGVTPSIKQQLKRRSAIEPHIGHMKSDGKLRRCFLKGQQGNQLNALLCAIGHNLRMILNKLRDFLVLFWGMDICQIFFIPSRWTITLTA